MAITDENGFTLVDYDYATGRSVWHYYDGEKDIYRTDYPVDAVISENTTQRNMAQKTWAGDYHHVASIPLNVLHSSGLIEANEQKDDKWVSRWLNDSDNRAWRTKEGNV